MRGTDTCDLAFAVLMAVLFVLVGATFKQYAVSNDEGLQHHYGELIIAYYKSGFTDRSVFNFDNLYLYGGLFDIIAVLLAHLLPFDLYDIRHVLSAIAGIGGVAASWATARMIAAAPRWATCRDRPCTVRRVVWWHVQSYQGRAVCLRHDGGRLFPPACGPRDLPRLRSGATSFGSGTAAGALRLGWRATRPFDGRICSAGNYSSDLDAEEAQLARDHRCGSPFSAAIRPGLGPRLRDHDRILAMGIARNRQSRARDLRLRPFSLPDPYDPRQPHLSG